MIVAIRISGRVDIKHNIRETLYKLRLRRKYSCNIFPEKKDSEDPQVKSLKNVRDYIAYGNINDETLKELIEKRGKPLNKDTKINPEKVVEELKKGKKLDEIGLKPFFRLHPPRKGIKSKEHFPKGVLGDHGEKINELVKKML
ncbi:MAG: 50S ribosomal protein L30 [Minisyncoccales bacterium]